MRGGDCEASSDEKLHMEIRKLASGPRIPLVCGHEGAESGQRHSTVVDGSSCQVLESHELVIS